MKIIFCDNGMRALLNFRIDVISHFVGKGCDVVLIYPESTHEAGREKDIPDGCRVIRIPVTPAGTSISEDLGYFRRLREIYREEKPDMVFHYSIKPNVYGSMAARLEGCRSVAMVAGLGYAFTGNSFGKTAGRILLKTGLKLSGHVLVLNTYIRDLLMDRKFIRKGRYTLLDGGEGVNLDNFPACTDSFGSTRFLLVARVLYDKGYSEFVQAARIVRERYPEVRFCILGPMDEQSPMGVPSSVLESDVRDGAVEYLGYSLTPSSVITEPGTAVVLPSWHEGMSRALMEAAALSRPIITSDIPGCREIVRDGVNGFLCSPKNASSLAAALMKFLEQSAEAKTAMSVESRRIAEERFDVRRVIEAYENLLEKL